MVSVNLRDLKLSQCITTLPYKKHSDRHYISSHIVKLNHYFYQQYGLTYYSVNGIFLKLFPSHLAFDAQTQFDIIVNSGIYLKAHICSSASTFLSC